MPVAIIIAVLATVVAVWGLTYGFVEDEDNAIAVGFIALVVMVFMWIGVTSAVIHHSENSDTRAAVTQTFNQQYRGDSVLFVVHPNDETVEFGRQGQLCMMSFHKDFKHNVYFGPEYCTPGR